MPMAVQVKLLRALQEGEIEPLGSNKLLRFDVRVVAATSRDLQQMVRNGQFREDLYYRLNVLPIRVPPLRERRDDLALLVEALCEDIAARGATAHLEIEPAALDLLAAQPWRGNIRELRNVLEQLALRSDSPQIDAPQVEQVLRESGLERIEPPRAPAVGGGGGPPPQPSVDERPLPEQIAELEQRAIAAALARTGGNRAAAARLLGISRASLYDKLGGVSEIQTID
jgi:DNA-binding NtrC family response regulator